MSISAVSSSSSSYWEDLFGVTQGAKKAPQGGDLGLKLFGDLDSDGDGSISLKESGLDQDQYNSLDTNKDGQVSLAELETAVELQRSAMATQMMLGEGAAPAPDSDSGKPDAQGLLASILNGTLPPPPSMGKNGAAGKQDFVSALLEDLDDDDSGDLSLDETGLSQSVYDALDMNKDGTVSADELAAAFQQQQASTGNATDVGATASKLTRDFLSMLANNAYRAAGQALETSSLMSLNATV